MNSVNLERQLSKGVCAGVSPLGFCPSALPYQLTGLTYPQRLVGPAGF